MHAQGFVSAEYAGQTWTREQAHPTGLPTKPYCIAFPHADAQGVNQSALGVAVMQRPVTFQNMADPDEALEVMLVFMLANRNPEEQIQTLRNLATLFGQPEKLIALRDQVTLQGVESWLRRELHLGQGDGG
jgi:PTS system galactitol-specific IIA component